MNHNGGADEIVNSTEWRCRWWFRLTTEVISSPYVYDKWKLLHSHVFHLFIATYQNNTTIYTTGLFCSACTFSLMKNITLFACTLFFFAKFDFTCFFLLRQISSLHFDNYTFWDARIVPLYCTFTLSVFFCYIQHLQNCIMCTIF